MDWAAIVLAARRANAAYIEGPEPSKAAFAALGDVWIDQLQGDDHQAALSQDAKGGYHLSISGTRISQGGFLDLWDDVAFQPQAVQGGEVTSGVYSGQEKLWAWALKALPAVASLTVCGHSLGASRTHLTPLFLDPARVGGLYSFEAPKFCSTAYYAAHAAALAGGVYVLNGRDLWAAWPWIDFVGIWGRPQPEHLWLHDKTSSMINPNTWDGSEPADHDIGVVITALQEAAHA